MPRDEGLANIHDYRDIEVIAVNMPNVAGVRNVPWQTYQTTVDAIEAAVHEGQPLVRDLQRLDRDLVLARIEIGAFPLARIAVGELPAADLLHVGAELDDRAVHALRIELPLEEVDVAGEAGLQDEVRPLGGARDLPHEA